MTEPLSAVLTVAPAAEPRPSGPYQHAFWFAVLLAVALTLAGASFAVGAYEAAGQPETVVREYFAALQDGDAAAALGYGTVPSGPHDLLTPGVLAAQNAIGPMRDFAVRDVVRTGDEALVDVAYTVDLPSGPDSVRDTVHVVRQGHGWQLARSAIPVQVFADAGSALASFAGAAVRGGDHLMFPGAVPVTYATSNLELTPSSAVVRFVDSGDVTVIAAVGTAGQKAIVPALRSALAACLAGTSPTEPLCPMPDPQSDVPGSLRGTLTRIDTNRLTMTVVSDDGRVDIGGTVWVRATYQQLDANNLSSEQRTTAMTIEAHTYATAPGMITWGVS
jgi:hypothetical protein